jgi:two-component system, sensor histidine kinase and response regulator
MNVPMPIAGAYDYRLVALSILIAILASYAALDLAARVTANARGPIQFAWLFGGAVAMGTGIWSMHYIGMLAFSLPIPVLYDWPMVVVSLLAAILASGIALFVVSRQRMRLPQALIGSVIMGAGIATMHYTGMAAMRLDGICHYSVPLVTLSVVLAMVIALVALWLTFHFRNDAKGRWLPKLASAVLMGAAIPIMHYTGMAAANFTYTGISADISHSVSVSALGVAGIAIVTVMVLGLALLTSLVDRRFAALESSEERLRLIINTALDSVITMNGDGVITNWNSEAEKAFGWSSEEVLGKHLADLILPHRYREQYKRGLQHFLMTGEGKMLRQRHETTALHRAGHEFPVEVAISPVRFGDQWIFSSFIRDITENKRAQTELLMAKQAAEDASQAKSIFLANMSHELRTPLNAIIGYSEMLEEETEALGKTSVVQDLKKIQSAGKHLLSLINDILDLSKIEAGKMGLDYEQIDVAFFVREITSTIEPTAMKNANAFRVDLADDLGHMRADATKLRQVLFNLLSNSCKFTKNGLITLKVDRITADGQSWAQFLITDTGIGITTEQRETLFKEFSQADTSIARKYGGTGLGLAISDRFVKMMKGNISVESEPGQGSTFTVRVPVDEAAAGSRGITAQEENESESHVGDRSNKDIILVIDDDPSVRDIMSRFLTKLGFAVVTAKNGAEGIRLARKVRPRLITLDVMMPQVDGWEVLKTLKADPELVSIPVIMITIVDGKPTATELGASDYLMKPVDRDRLAVMVEQYRSAPSV